MGRLDSAKRRGPVEIEVKNFDHSSDDQSGSLGGGGKSKFNTNRSNQHLNLKGSVLGEEGEDSSNYLKAGVKSSLGKAKRPSKIKLKGSSNNLSIRKISSRPGSRGQLVAPRRKDSLKQESSRYLEVNGEPYEAGEEPSPQKQKSGSSAWKVGRMKMGSHGKPVRLSKGRRRQGKIDLRRRSVNPGSQRENLILNKKPNFASGGQIGYTSGVGLGQNHTQKGTGEAAKESNPFDFLDAQKHPKI